MMWQLSDRRQMTTHIETAEGRKLFKLAGATDEELWQAVAAPKMLIALRAIQKSCPTDPDVTREFNAAWGLLESAIAAAEGRS